MSDEVFEIDGYEVTVGKTTYVLDELSIERTLRVTDLVVTVLDSLSSTMQQEFSEWTNDYAMDNQIAVEPEDIAASEELQQRLKDLGQDPSSINDTVYLPGTPSEAEVIGFFFPRVWKVARPQLLTVFALLLANNNDMANAEDEPGGIDAYLKTISKRIKHEGKIADLIALANLAFKVGKTEFERLRAEGNLPAPLMGLASNGSPQASSDEEQTHSTSSDTTTTGPDKTSSTESAGQSSSN